ncbi:MAG: exosortase U [Pirellulaceae bacterium]
MSSPSLDQLQVQPEFERHVNRLRLRTAFAVFLLALAHTPLLVEFFLDLWKRPHYRFYSFVLPGVAWLLWINRPKEPVDRGRIVERIEATFLLVGLVILAAAVLFWSGWLAALAAFVNGIALLARFGGSQGLWRLLPVWIVLLLVIPPPFGTDVQIIERLQAVSGQAGSVILDAFGVTHYVAGTVLGLPDQAFPIDAGTSGVLSLFAFVACTALFILWAGRPLLAALILLVAGVAWFAAAEAWRVVTLGVMEAWLGIDPTIGWTPEVIGAVWFLVGLAIVVSSDALVFFLITPVPVGSTLESSNPLSWFWNRVIARATIDVPMAEDGDFTEEEELIGDRTAKEEPVRPLSEAAHPAGEAAGDAPYGDGSGLSAAGASPASDGLLSSWAMLGLLGGLAVIAWSVVRLPSSDEANHAGGPRSSLAQSAASLGADLLPKQVRDWRCVDFSTARRPRSGVTGTFSNLWVYERAGHPTLRVTVDYPVTGWKSVVARQRSLGWKLVTSQEVRVEPSSSGSRSASGIEARLELPTGDVGYLLCGTREDAGKFWNWLNTEFRRGRLAIAAGLNKTIDPTAFRSQMHLLVQSPGELRSEQQREVRDCFFELKNVLQHGYSGYSSHSVEER